MVTTTAAPLTVSRQSWAKSLLQRLGASQSPTTINAVVAWEAAEGGAGPQFGVRNNVTTYNPLNVTLTYGSKGYGQTPGSSAFYSGATPTPGNTPPVAAFKSWTQGLTVTAARLQQPFAAGVLKALKAGTNTAGLSSAVVASGWGTPSFAGGAATNATASTTGVIRKTTQGAGTTSPGTALKKCVISFPGFLFFSGPCILTQGGVKALKGATALVAGSLIGITGVLILAATGLGSTGAAGAVSKVAGFLPGPVGTAAKVAGGGKGGAKKGGARKSGAAKPSGDAADKQYQALPPSTKARITRENKNTGPAFTTADRTPGLAQASPGSTRRHRPSRKASQHQAA